MPKNTKISNGKRCDVNDEKSPEMGRKKCGKRRNEMITIKMIIIMTVEVI